MSLIDKIDAEIASLKKVIVSAVFSPEVYGTLMGKIQMAERIKEFVLSEQKEPLTIGDKIRESNESLAEVIHNSCWCDYCGYYEKKCDGMHRTKNKDCKQGILDYLNQPYTES